MIVCVLDMTSNLTNQNAIDMAKEADPSGTRTLGVVTKPDRAVSADTNALDQLGSGVFKMGLGFVVVNRKKQLSYTPLHICKIYQDLTVLGLSPAVHLHHVVLS